MVVEAVALPYLDGKKPESPLFDGKLKDDGGRKYACELAGILYENIIKKKKKLAKKKKYKLNKNNYFLPHYLKENY